MEEVWKEVKGYEGIYEISNYGRVKGLVRKRKTGGWLKERYLRPHPNQDGYLLYNICGVGIDRSIVAHSLVWDHFGNAHRKNGLVIDHIDEDKKNNHISNLQLLTNRQNCVKGRKKYNYSSKYPGVSFFKRDKTFRAYYMTGNRFNHIGYFKNELDAKVAYENAIKALR